MYKVVGMSRSTGVYEGNAYDNSYFYCTYEEKHTEGVRTISYKCKTKNVKDAIKIGDTIGVYFDQWNNPACVYKI